MTPVIGIPLPFFSYGGSSLWGFTLLLFIFLRVRGCGCGFFAFIGALVHRRRRRHPSCGAVFRQRFLRHRDEAPPAQQGTGVAHVRQAVRIGRCARIVVSCGPLSRRARAFPSPRDKRARWGFVARAGVLVAPCLAHRTSRRTAGPVHPRARHADTENPRTPPPSAYPPRQPRESACAAHTSASSTPMTAVAWSGLTVSVVASPSTSCAAA